MVSWPLIQPSSPSPIPDIPHSTLHTLLHTPVTFPPRPNHTQFPNPNGDHDGTLDLRQKKWALGARWSTRRIIMVICRICRLLIQCKAKAWFWSTAFLWTKFCRLRSVIWVSLGWLSHTFSFSFNPWILAIYDFPMFSGHGKREESWMDNYADLFAVSCEPCLWHPRHCIFLCSIQGWPGSGIENTRTRLDLTERERT